MRQYEPIWIAIKENNTASLVADLSQHATIKKAVIKEKHKDVAFKLLCSEKGIKYKLRILTSKNLIKFILFDTSL